MSSRQTILTVFGSAAIAFSIGAVVMLSVASGFAERTAGAQSATPVAGIAVDPTLCAAEPISTDQAAELLATPIA